MFQELRAEGSRTVPCASSRSSLGKRPFGRDLTHGTRESGGHPHGARPSDHCNQIATGLQSWRPREVPCGRASGMPCPSLTPETSPVHFLPSFRRAVGVLLCVLVALSALAWPVAGPAAGDQPRPRRTRRGCCGSTTTDTPDPEPATDRSPRPRNIQDAVDDAGPGQPDPGLPRPLRGPGGDHGLRARRPAPDPRWSSRVRLSRAPCSVARPSSRPRVRARAVRWCGSMARTT